MKVSSNGNRSRSTALIVQKKKRKHKSGNLKQVFMLARDALTERKTIPTNINSLTHVPEKVLEYI